MAEILPGVPSPLKPIRNLIISRLVISLIIWIFIRLQHKLSQTSHWSRCNSRLQRKIAPEANHLNGLLMDLSIDETEISMIT